MNIFFPVFLGLVSGILSGFLGIGGGTIIIPALVYIANFSQHQAQGTTLALMVPPIGLLAAMRYYQAGYIDIKIAALICVGFFIGGFIGATFVMPVSDILLRRIFGVFLLFVAIRMIIVK